MTFKKIIGPIALALSAANPVALALSAANPVALALSATKPLALALSAATSLALALSAISSAALAADAAFVFHDGAPGLSADISSNLATHLTNAGYATTSASSRPGLSGFRQVWDVRYDNSTPLTAGDQFAYLGYLQGGGTLFVMGENAAFPARNNTLVSLITAAGGGTLTVLSSANHQTVQGSFATTPNNVAAVDYLAVGGYTSAGTGTCITKDGANRCGAIAFGVGQLANAPNGALVSVLDVNFLQASAGANFSAFIDNLIAYLAAQSDISSGRGGFVPVSTPITHGAAVVLDQVSVAPSIDVDMAQAIGELSSLPSAQKGEALNRLTPPANSALAMLGSGATDAGLSTVSGRLEGLRNADTLGWAEPADRELLVAAAGATSGLLEARELRHGIWGKLFGGDTRQDADDGFAGYKADTWGLTFGADTRLEEGTVVGGAFTYAASNLDQEDFLSGSGTDFESYQATLYADHDFGSWYLEGLLTYAQQRYDSHRETGVTGVAQAEFDGDLWGARIAAGLPHAIRRNLVVTPFASLEYSHLTQDGYQESGAGPLDLTVDGTSADRLRSGLGVALAGEVELGTTKVRPEVHVQWLHDFNNDGISTTANFAGGGAAFTTPGQDVPGDTANIGGRLMFSVSRNALLSLHYDYEGASGYSNQTGQVVVQYWF